MRLLFAANLRRLRRRAGLTHEALADASNLNRTYFTGVEAGRRNVSLDNVDKIARALGVDPIELLLEPRPEPKTETSNPSK